MNFLLNYAQEKKASLNLRILLCSFPLMWTKFKGTFYEIKNKEFRISLKDLQELRKTPDCNTT